LEPLPSVLPQHSTALPAVTAQAVEGPRDTAFTPLVRPGTSTGTELDAAAEPLPSSPTLLSPQHSTAPPEVTAQAKKSPTDTAMAVVLVAESPVPIDPELKVPLPELFPDPLPLDPDPLEPPSAAEEPDPPLVKPPLLPLFSTPAPASGLLSPPLPLLPPPHPMTMNVAANAQ
jgi:hypothetical protein